jgi:uncharacterized protein (TIGR03086 family)
VDETRHPAGNQPQRRLLTAAGDAATGRRCPRDGFAAAAAGRGADPAVWQAPERYEDPASAYVEAADHVIAAFAADGAQRAFSLPEISTEATFPGPLAIGFHVIDYVVHSWDVARSLRVPLQLPRNLVDAALPLARTVPDGPERRST